MQYTFNAGRRQLAEPFFTLPESFDPAQVLPAKLKKRHDDARYAVSLIMGKMAAGKVDERGRVPLMASSLANVMAEDDCKAVIECLLCSGILHRDYYAVGKKPYSYWLDSRFQNDRHVRRPIECKRLKRALNRLSVAREAEQESRILPIHKYLRDMQASLTIDMDQATRILPKIGNSFDTQSILVNRLNERVYSFSVGTYGRVSTSISNLKKELRSALRLENQPLGCLDLSNSQPALLGMILKDHGKKENREGDRTDNHIYDPENEVRKIELNEKEVADYCELVQTGTFYEWLNLGFPNLTRKEVQRRFLADVLAKLGKYPSAIEDYFRKRFPSIYRFIRAFNRRDHAALIRQLQVVESELVIETVSDSLRVGQPGMPFLTLHDCIFAAPDRLGDVRQAFDSAFQANGFTMKLKLTEDLSNPKEVAA
ncbi:hypothetical protein SH449x_002457 [Pirellulaceae bacterium SH449]